MGRIANEYAKHIIVTADNPRFEDPDLICEDIVAGIVNKDKLTILLNRREAITTAIKKSNEYSNSVILVLGKGDEEHQIIYDKKLPFSDDEVIKEIINAK
jgi:UDP-N-acetylmuramoyl-L-alanyl-D-glutamate--2,6-diaminopimelate ligase